MEGIGVRIGRERDYVAISVLGRLHPNACDYWDGNWLATPIQVRAGGFRGEVGGSLRADELRRFREALERAYASVSGEAELASMEEWLSLRLAVSTLGHVEVEGRVVDPAGTRNELRFHIDGLDQTDVPPIVRALRKAEAVFPVVGDPSSPPDTRDT